MESPSILFIAPDRIGDAVLASAVLRHIAAKHPQARVTLAASTLTAPLYQSYPLLARLIRLPPEHATRRRWQLWRATCATRWSAVWDLRGSLMPYLLHSEQRRRFAGNDAPIPRVEQYAQHFQTGALPYPVLWTHAANQAQAKAMLPERDRYVAFAPIASCAAKEWPMEHYIALGRRLFTEGGPCTDWRPVVICSAHEREKAAPLLKALAPYRPVDLTRGALPLLSVYACLQRTHGFIGNDSGLMHMAAAAGAPTLGIFGPTSPIIYGPYGLRTGTVNAPEGKLSELVPETVEAAAAKLFRP